jgi:hypothetical protein
VKAFSSRFLRTQNSALFTHIYKACDFTSFLAWVRASQKRSLASLTLAAAVGLVMVPAAYADYSEIISFDNGFYTYKAYASSSPITWTVARNFARSKGWDLTSLDTESENEFVFAKINTVANALWNGQLGPYIGLFQEPGSPEPTNGWKWVDNTLLSYNGWEQGEPNNGSGGDIGDNVALYLRNGGRWADVYDCATLSGPCSSGNSSVINPYLATSFVIEFKRVPAPAPVFGVMAAMAWARRLRRRTQQSCP